MVEKHRRCVRKVSINVVLRLYWKEEVLQICVEKWLMLP
jgi:hypothetical protein